MYDDQLRRTKATQQVWNWEQLVDITTVKLNPSDSVEKRLDSYIQQIKNPYLFKVSDIAVKIEFAGEKSFEALLASLLSSNWNCKIYPIALFRAICYTFGV